MSVEINNLTKKLNDELNIGFMNVQEAFAERLKLKRRLILTERYIANENKKNNKTIAKIFMSTALKLKKNRIQATKPGTGIKIKNPLSRAISI